MIFLKQSIEINKKNAVSDWLFIVSYERGNHGNATITKFTVFVSVFQMPSVLHLTNVKLKQNEKIWKKDNNNKSKK